MRAAPGAASVIRGDNQIKRDHSYGGGIIVIGINGQTTADMAKHFSLRDTLHCECCWLAEMVKIPWAAYSQLQMSELLTFWSCSPKLKPSTFYTLAPQDEITGGEAVRSKDTPRPHRLW